MAFPSLIGIDNGANYILSVKENEASLLESFKDKFIFSKQIMKSTSIDSDHVRMESRAWLKLQNLSV